MAQGEGGGIAMPGFDGIVVLLCVALCLVLGLAGDVIVAAFYGWTWWLVVPPLVAIYAGHRLAAWAEA